MGNDLIKEISRSGQGRPLSGLGQSFCWLRSRFHRGKLRPARLRDGMVPTTTATDQSRNNLFDGAFLDAHLPHHNLITAVETPLFSPPASLLVAEANADEDTVAGGFTGDNETLPALRTNVHAYLQPILSSLFGFHGCRSHRWSRFDWRSNGDGSQS